MLTSSNCTVVYLTMPCNELHCLINVSATETDLEYCVGLLQLGQSTYLVEVSTNLNGLHLASFYEKKYKLSMTVLY